MKSKIILLLAGLVLGALVTLAIVLPRQAAEQAELAAAQENERLKFQQQLSTAKKRAEQLELDNAKVTAELLDLRSVKAAAAEPKSPKPAGKSSRRGGFAAMFGGDDGTGTNKFASAMAGMVKAAMKSRVDSKITALKRRLKLTDQQEAQVRDILEKQFGAAGEMATRMFSGKASKEEMQTAGSSIGDTLAQVKAILTPEQQTEYATYLEEERQTNASMMANVELSQMQQLLQLDQTQQQQVYNVLYDQSLKNLPAGDDGAAHMPTDWQKQADAKVEALKSVLTPEQFDAYKKQQDAQKQMINAMMESFGGGSNANVSANGSGE